MRNTAMAPNEQARKNHDELFAGSVSTLAVTDPELIDGEGVRR
jgi:4-carboxymuconolactone decarboxylase